MNTTTPLVSVILPFRGRSPWLQEAIRSILEQSLTDWELLLIDNGAEASAIKTARNIATNDTRIRIIEESRAGISHALNTGIKSARSAFIARMDDDDIAHPQRLELQWQTMRKESHDTVVACRVSAVDDFAPREGMQEYMNWQNGLISAADHYLNRFVDAPVVHPSIFCRKDLFERYGNYTHAEIPEDYELWLRWMEAGVQFVKTEQALLAWRDHDDRLTRSHRHYEPSRFAEVRLNYLIRWLKKELGPRQLIFCGTSRKSRKRAQQLIAAGIRISAYTDVKQQYRDIPFVSLAEINKRDDHFYLSLLHRRASNQLRDFLYKRGLTEGQDFLLAG